MLALVVALPSCGTKKASRHPAGGGESKLPQEAGERVDITKIEIPYFAPDGKRKWVVKADRATAETDKGATDLVGVECEVFERDAMVARAKAESIHIDYEKEHMLLAGDVAVRFAEREMDFKCKEFRWDWDDGGFVGEGGVVFAKGGVTGRADGIRGNTRGGKLALY